MDVVGIGLVVFGVALLVAIDAPRLVARLRLDGPGRAGAVAGAAGSASAGGPANSVVNRPGAHEHGPKPDSQQVQPTTVVLQAFAGLPPGWYRDSFDPAMARYWDGATLSEETRLVATPQEHGVPPPEAAYRGLAPGWYRDSSNPAMARYWDGVALSEQRRPVAE